MSTLIDLIDGINKLSASLNAACLLSSGTEQEQHLSYSLLLSSSELASSLAKTEILYGEESNTIQASTSAQKPPSFDGIVERIRSRRVALGLTTEELSTQLGYKSDVVEDWESDCDTPEMNILLPIASALHCDPLWLLGDFDGTEPPAPAEKPLAPIKIMQGVDMSGVGKRIRESRVSRRMTHTELENAAHLPEGVTSVWESGKAYPPDEAFDKLAKALNTSVIWLLTGREVVRES